MTESHKVFEEEGLDSYKDYQISREGQPLKQGFAFELVKKLLGLNDSLTDKPVEVILLSRNSADTGLRVFNSIQHYGLDISRAAFTGGNYPYSYVNAFDCHLFLSADGADVRAALDRGVAAATILPSEKHNSSSETLKIAFDGDAVLFSDESEKVFKRSGLQAFSKNERESANIPLEGGPFRPFLFSLQQIQQAFPEGKTPIRTCLVTARSAPAHERVIKTLRAWNIRIDESLFLGGLDKGEFLKAFDADVFFDDQRTHCESARNHVTTGHVPNGITND